MPMKSSIVRASALLKGVRGTVWAVVLGNLLIAFLLIAVACLRPQKLGIGLRHEDFATESYKQHLVRAAQILVKFRTSGESLSAKQAESLSKTILAGAWDARPIGHHGAFVIHSLDKIRVNTLIDAFRAPEFRDKVEYAEPDYVLDFETDLPTDRLFEKQWGLRNIGQALGRNGCLISSDPVGAGKPSADIKAVDAWQITTGSMENIVVILDTGIDFTHDDLRGNIWTADKQYSVALPGGDVVTCDQGTHGFDAITTDLKANRCVPMDYGDHGTHLAGIIGAQQDGSGIVGVNWNVRMMAVRAFSISDTVRGLSFVVEAKKQFPNIRVVNNSYGWTDQELGSHDLKTLFDEFQTANDADLLLVASAGDCELCGDETKHFPSGFDLSNSNIVSVTATDNTDENVPFSFDFRSQKLLGAPGIKICSTVPGNGYAAIDGSSMAAAFVSGAAALVLSNSRAHCDKLSAWGVKKALLNEADQVPKLAPRIPYGRRLNAFAAVNNCSQYLSP